VVLSAVGERVTLLTSNGTSFFAITGTEIKCGAVVADCKRFVK
jgi:hypothetical protein